MNELIVTVGDIACIPDEALVQWLLQRSGQAYWWSELASIAQRVTPPAPHTIYRAELYAVPQKSRLYVKLFNGSVWEETWGLTFENTGPQLSRVG